MLDAPTAKECQTDRWLGGPQSQSEHGGKEKSLLPGIRAWLPIGPAHGQVTILSKNVFCAIIISTVGKTATKQSIKMWKSGVFFWVVNWHSFEGLLVV